MNSEARGTGGKGCSEASCSAASEERGETGTRRRSLPERAYTSLERSDGEY